MQPVLLPGPLRCTACGMQGQVPPILVQPMRVMRVRGKSIPCVWTDGCRGELVEGLQRVRPMARRAEGRRAAH